ncbi:MAG TPA: hypothetical protein VGO62_13610 [Myxococcota bacterium]|jgi:hypothetical protein
MPKTVPFVRAAFAVAAMREVDTRLDDAALMLRALEARHGVRVHARSSSSSGGLPVDAGDALTFAAPFLAETWLCIPGEWIGELDVTARGRTLAASPRRWAALVAEWAAERFHGRGFTYLDFATFGDCVASLDEYGTFMRAARRIIAHAQALDGGPPSARRDNANSTVGFRSLVTVQGTWQGAPLYELSIVAGDEAVRGSGAVAWTSATGRALLGARVGDVVDTDGYGAVRVLRVR